MGDQRLESEVFNRRAVAAVILVVIACSILLSQLYGLQVTQHAHYQTRSDDNHVRLQSVAPMRGLILDRNGVLLADNQPSYRLVVTPSRAGNMKTLLRQLGEFIGFDDRELRRFNRAILGRQSFQQTPLKFNLSDQELALFAVRQHQFPGVEVLATSTRYYPQHEYFTHTLGYVGRMNRADQQRMDAKNYRATTHIGKLGLEKYYEDILHGEVGYQHDEINAQGRRQRVLRTEQAKSGIDLKLSLITEVQKVATNALGMRRGAVVAIDPNNGDVLAFVSMPSFDPNLFVNGISQKAYSALRLNSDRPLFNRALIGQYPPGSTVKPIIALAALEEGQINAEDTIFAGPYFKIPKQSRRYRDWKKGGHGRVNLKLALAQSCDVYFYRLGFAMGITPMHDMLRRFDLGSQVGLDTAGEASGLVPSTAWKRRVHGEAWYPGESVITSIGQGYLLATPLQLAQMTARIAMNGVGYKPRFVIAQRETKEDGFAPLEPTALPSIDLKQQEHWQQVLIGMRAVVNGRTGTARNISKGASYDIAGKSGTAQVISIAQDSEYEEADIAQHLRDHALFIAYAPIEQPKIAVAVIVENGGSGSRIAAPIARKVMDAYLLKRTTDGQ